MWHLTIAMIIAQPVVNVYNKKAHCKCKQWIILQCLQYLFVFWEKRWIIHFQKWSTAHSDWARINFFLFFLKISNNTKLKCFVQIISQTSMDFLIRGSDPTFSLKKEEKKNPYSMGEGEQDATDLEHDFYHNEKMWMWTRNCSVTTCWVFFSILSSLSPFLIFMQGTRHFSLLYTLNMFSKYKYSVTLAHWLYVISKYRSTY